MKKLVYLMAGIMMGGAFAHAGGFAQNSFSGAAAGVADAFVATANDASAVVYNPAGIAWLPGVSVTAGASLYYRDSSVELAGGIAPNSGTEPNAAHIYMTWAPLDSQWGAGFGFVPQHHINNNWSSSSFGTPAAGITELVVDHASFDVSYAVSSSFAVAAGVDWYLTRANVTQTGSNFNENDLASFGGHAALMWKPAPAWSVGLTGRSGAKVSASSAGNTLDFKLPDELTIGVAHDFADVWRLETDLKWTRWSAVKSINVTGTAAQTNTVTLNDTLTVMAGLTWTWYPRSQLRFGYAYDQGANSTSGFNPIMADQDGHRISFGAGGEVMNMHLDLAYSYTFYNNTVATGTYAGTYRDRKQAVVLSLSKTFE